MIGSVKFRWIIILCCCWLSSGAQTSFLHAGEWYKLSVEKNGVYRISYDLLRKMGVDPGRIDPRNIRIFGREGGMLPQDNSIDRPLDLRECAILVSGEQDGKFDRGDYILFYGEGPDDYEFDVKSNFFAYENNLYSENNFYFLTISDDIGKRVSISKNTGGAFPEINTYNAFAFYEKDAVNIDRSGRQWYGEKFGLVNSYTLTYNIPGIMPGSQIGIVSDVMGQSYTEATFKLFLNNAQVAEQKIGPIPGGRYSVRGLHQRDTVFVNADDVGAAARSSQEVKYEFVKGTGFSQGYLNFIMINYSRKLALYDNQTFFLSAPSLGNPSSTFRVSGVSATSQIWDITDHYNASSQEFDISSSEATFSTTTDQLKKWMVFNENVPEPVFVKKVDNKDLSGLPTPDLLIITHSDFKGEAERLALHRSAFNIWSVHVVTTEEIFNQFSGGRQDVSALRDFAKFLRDKDPATFKAILLFGKGSYDYKDRLANNTNFVPTYQSRNSLHPLQTYSSDDYFAFLEEGEGVWAESPAQHHTLDVGVGRLPVTSVAEARAVVDKIIDYDLNQKALGPWRKKIVFVADDGNSEDNFTSLHQYQADQLANNIEQSNPDVDTRRLFMGSYKKVAQPNSETVPDLVNDIKKAFNEGSLIINFTGHGSETVWADERVFTDKTITELKNDLYPFLVTATCEFGRQDDPLQISSAEMSVTHPEGGSIGLVTTARPVNATTNFSLNEAFYVALMERNPNGYAPIGEVFRKTKNNSTSGVANRNFSLIGDPSMTLALPDYYVNITSLKTVGGSDTLKALSTVVATGHVLDAQGEIATTFNGVVEGTLHDKKTDFVTIGKNNPAFHYQQWQNAVFRGQVSVKGGSFEFKFIMPTNVSPAISEGRFSLYAFDPGSGIDAKGVNTTLHIGGTEPNVPIDATPPSIRVYMGDTTFVNGGITTSDTYLVARLTDESGINITGLEPGNSVIGELDGQTMTYVLNDYYVTDVDTHKKGTIRFPILGLAPGPHTLTIHAWDVYNNPAVAEVSFFVTDGDALQINEFGNYPNPFDNHTTLFFTHNRSGDDLRAQLFIFNLAGELIKSADISISESAYHINLMELNTWEESGKKLPPGLYLARVIVRSMSNGSKNEKVTKLIVLN